MVRNNEREYIRGAVVLSLLRLWLREREREKERERERWKVILFGGKLRGEESCNDETVQGLYPIGF